MERYSIEDVNKLKHHYYFESMKYSFSPEREKHYNKLYLMLSDREEEMKKRKQKMSKKRWTSDKYERRERIKRHILASLKVIVPILATMLLVYFLCAPPLKIIGNYWETKAQFTMQVDEVNNGKRELFNIFEYKDGENIREIKSRTTTIIKNEEDKPSDEIIYYNPNNPEQSYFEYEIIPRLSFGVFIGLVATITLIGVAVYYFSGGENYE